MNVVDQVLTGCGAVAFGLCCVVFLGMAVFLIKSLFKAMFGKEEGD